jgi:hypothetical protein
MEGKYYTPEIEDFVIGFEFEQQKYSREVEWYPRIVESYFFATPSYGPGECGEAEISEVWDALQRGYIRAKHIDNPDVMSLGWLVDEELEPIGYVIKSENKTFILRGFEGATLIQILSDQRQIFFGSLKNKSDLKRLMVQLAIHGK